MPRFFFDVHDGVSFADKEGTELPSWHEAQIEAIRLAGVVIADGAKRLKLGEDWMMEVRTEDGLILFRLDFHVAGTAAIVGSDWKPGGA